MAYGRETVAAARRGGNSTQVWYAQINLVLALWVRGEWSDLTTTLGTVRMVGATQRVDQLVLLSTDLLLTAATGRATPLLEDISTDDPPELHGTDRAWGQWLTALRLAREGRPAEALGDAVRAVEVFGTVYDDFHHFWATAVALAQEVGDVAAEERLFAMVDSVNAVIPLALRAHRARFAAAAARRDAGTDPLGRTPEASAPEVERLLREAVELYATWGSLPYEAQARGELGGWLARQGRPDEAEPLLDAARSRLREIGAVRWLDDLELSLVAAG